MATSNKPTVTLALFIKTPLSIHESLPHHARLQRSSSVIVHTRTHTSVALFGAHEHGFPPLLEWVCRTKGRDVTATCQVYDTLEEKCLTSGRPGYGWIWCAQGELWRIFVRDSKKHLVFFSKPPRRRFFQWGARPLSEQTRGWFAKGSPIFRLTNEGLSCCSKSCAKKHASLDLFLRVD